MSSNGHRYDVGGVLLERPFKIRRLGHFGFNINKLAEAREFYGDLLGFTVSDKADFSGAPWFPKDKGLGDAHGYFMRYGSDHHAMVLFSKPVMDVRADRKFAPEVTINQITWQCGSLKEIAEAHSYFEEQQVRALYADLAIKLRDGVLKAPIEATYPIEDIKQALTHAQRGGRNGKVLVLPNGRLGAS